MVTAIRGVSARARLEALIAGARDVTVLADFARGRLRAKRDRLEEALRGYGTPHPSCLLTEYLRPIAYLDEAIARVSALIAQHLEAEQEATALLDTIPGGSQRTAEILWAASGTAMARFPRAKQLACWAGIGPGNDDSGGQRLSGKTRKGRRWRRQVLVDAAHVAAKTQQTYLAAQ